MKRVILMLLILLNPLFSNFDKLTLRELARLAASDINKNIIVPKKIPKIEVEVNLEDNQGRGALYQLFQNVLFAYDLRLKRRGKYYIVVKDDYKDIKKKLHTFKYCFKGVTADDAKELMSIFDIKFKYLLMNDCIVYRSTKDLKKEIRAVLKSTDTKLKTKVIKLTIFATNLEKLKNDGIFTDGLELGFENFVDTYFGDSGTSTTYELKAVANFKAVLKYLQQRGISNIMQSPTILLTNGVPATFKAVRTIPYLQTKSKVQDTKQSTTEEYSYKDVGLQIKITPKIKRNYIYLTLNLISEDIVSLNNNRPITQKIEYKNSVILKKGRAILLTGFKKVSKSRTYQRNIFTYIPIIGRYLGGKTNDYQKMQISLFIQML